MTYFHEIAQHIYETIFILQNLSPKIFRTYEILYADIAPLVQLCVCVCVCVCVCMRARACVSRVCI